MSACVLQHIAAFFETVGEEGLLYISFGTFKQFNKEVVDRVTAAVATLPYKVIWKCNMQLSVALDPARVLILDWVPQNDILAHPKTRAFLTHGGMCCVLVVGS